MGLHYCTQAFSSWRQWGLLSSCCGKGSHYGDFLCCRAQALKHSGFNSCGPWTYLPLACVIFPDQGLNPCPLHWQADSQTLDHQGSPPELSFFFWGGSCDGGLCCFMLSLSCSKQGLLSSCGESFSLVSLVLENRISCPMAYGIFQDQGIHHMPPTL